MPNQDLSPDLYLLEILNKINALIRQNRSLEETLLMIVKALASRKDLTYFNFYRIVFDDKEYSVNNSNGVPKSGEISFQTKSGKTACLLYSDVKGIHSDNLSDEEHDYILKSIMNTLKRYLNSMESVGKNRLMPVRGNKQIRVQKDIISSKFLQRFLNKNTYTRDVYHDLMPFKVKDILLISSLYDAYAIERDGRFTEHMLGQYGHLNLTTVPRITGASTVQQAFDLLKKKHFDQIIYMVGVDKKTPLLASRQIKEKYHYIPIFLLLNNNSDVSYFRSEQQNLPYIDRVFTWNGDSNIFFSMIKLLEDKINVENDTRMGQVRVILLAEDSPMYSSRYLSFLYKVIMEQTKRIIDDVSTDALYKVLRMRARPKILFASTFEQAVEVIDKYGDYLLCLITDVKYEQNGIVNENAGVELLDYARQELKNLPVVMQSSDPSYAEVAHQYNSLFIDKNSETLYEDLQDFITNYLGFGDFVFKNSKGEKIAQAANLWEFEHHLIEIPDDSLLYHASRNHFSMWLMARQEIKAANFINPKKVSDFKDAYELRTSLVQMIKEHRDEQETGNIIPYQNHYYLIPGNFYTLSDGSLGGKGRGLAFINALIHNYDFSKLVTDIKIKTPVTAIIGTLEFELFIAQNDLKKMALFEDDYTKVKKAFLEELLSDDLHEKLASLLTKITKPIAVRSSSLFEDSLTLPFSGIFETYILPNNHESFEVRLQQLCQAVKLVYASLYSNVSKGYVRAIDYKLEDEKMAVIIEEVVGNQYGDMYYPHISGVAQSYNYYPFAHMKPEEGFALAAVGLGKYVVEGNRAYRFSPNYPDVEINTPKDQFKNSQLKFYSVDLTKKNLDLMEGEDAGLVMNDIDLAESHGTLKHCVSVYHADNDTIYPGLTNVGPRIVNFANVLKYNYIPLAKTLKVLLELGKEAMGTAVEMEYAVDLNRDKEGRASFYILQIKPLISQHFDCEVDISKIAREDMLLYTEIGMGNGIVDSIEDVIYVDNTKFDKLHTVEMAAEIEVLNEKMVAENRRYILIGPGRWGTRDKWIGIPIRWAQISNAKVMVETSLADFPLDASSGSHFFHNVTSMNVGYFTIQSHLKHHILQYDLLNKQKALFVGKYFRHVRFKKALKVEMDGKNRRYVIHL